VTGALLAGYQLRTAITVSREAGPPIEHAAGVFGTLLWFKTN